MITDNQIKEILVSNAIEWNKEESQDRAFIYVDDFVKELQGKLKLLGIADVVGRSEQLLAFTKWLDEETIDGLLAEPEYYVKRYLSQ